MIGQDIAQAAALLRQGEVIAMPTETVYGLAGNALDEKAVAKIFAIKQRPTFDPLIVHLPAASHLEKWAKSIPAAAQKLAEAPLGQLILCRNRRLFVLSARSQRAVHGTTHPPRRLRPRR